PVATPPSDTRSAASVSAASTISHGAGRSRGVRGFGWLRPAGRSTRRRPGTVAQNHSIPSGVTRTPGMENVEDGLPDHRDRHQPERCLDDEITGSERVGNDSRPSTEPTTNGLLAIMMNNAQD